MKRQRRESVARLLRSNVVPLTAHELVETQSGRCVCQGNVGNRSLLALYQIDVSLTMNPLSISHVAGMVVAAMAMTVVSVPMIWMIAGVRAVLIITKQRDTIPMSHFRCRWTSNRGFA